MMRSVIWVMTMGLGLGTVASYAAAEASPIATSMGDLRWGLSEHDVSSAAKRELALQYNGEIAHTKDAGKQSKLKAELKSAVGAVDKSLTSFDKKGSRWDNSPVAGEFTYDNNESMLVGKGPDTDNYYFFVSGRLWKIVKVFDKKSAGDFKKFSQSVESKFGKGRSKNGELTPGQGSTQWLEYLDRNSRMRAADSSSKRPGYAMIYEEMATVRELASTRPKAPTRLGGVSDDDDSAPKNQLKASAGEGKNKAAATGGDEQIAKAATSNKRSVFGNERHDESDGEYQTRKQKLAAEARDRAQRAHDRKEDAKKGEALKQLDGLNDSDPLGGL